MPRLMSGEHLVNGKIVKKRGAPNLWTAPPRKAAPAKTENPFTKSISDILRMVQSVPGITHKLASNPQVVRQVHQNNRVAQAYNRAAYTSRPGKASKQTLVHWAFSNPHRSESRIIIDAAGGISKAKDLLRSQGLDNSADTSGVEPGLEWLTKKSREYGNKAQRAVEGVLPQALGSPRSDLQAAGIIPKSPVNVTKAASNLVGSAASIIPAVGLTTYQLGRDIVEKGPIKAAKKDVVDPLGQLVSHPGRSFENDPVGTYLAAAGVYGGVGALAGKTMRSGALGGAAAEAANTARPHLYDPKRDLLISRHYSPNPITKGAQVLGEAIREKPTSSPLTRREMGAPARADVIDRPLRSTQTNVRKTFRTDKPGVFAPKEGPTVTAPDGTVVKFPEGTVADGTHLRTPDGTSHDVSASTVKWPQKPSVRRGESVLAPVTNQAAKALNHATEARFQSEARRSGNERAEMSLIAKRGGRQLGTEAGPDGPGQYRKVGPLVKFADGTKQRMPYGTTLDRGMLVDPTGKPMRGLPEVKAFREPRVAAAVPTKDAIFGDRMTARVKAAKSRHVNKVENDLVPLVNQGILSREALQSGPDAVLAELVKERDAIDAGAHGVTTFENSNFQGSKLQEFGDRMVSNRANRQIIDNAIQKLQSGGLNHQHLLEAARSQAEASTRFQQSMTRAGGLAEASASRRPYIAAAQARGIAERDPGGVPTKAAIDYQDKVARVKWFEREVRHARENVLKAQRGVKEARRGKTAASKVVDRLTRKLVVAEKRLAKAQGHTHATEGYRTRRTTASIKKQIVDLEKQGHPLAVRAASAFRRLELGTKKLRKQSSPAAKRMARAVVDRAERDLNQILDEAAGQVALGSKDALARKMATVGRSGDTARLADLEAEVVGLRSQLERAKADHLLEKRANIDRAKHAFAEARTSFTSARNDAKAARQMRNALHYARNDKTTPRWVHKGKAGGHAKAISNREIEAELRRQGVDPADIAYVSGRPSKGANSDYYQRDTTNRTGYQGDAYTGKSMAERSAFSDSQSLTDQNARINVIRATIQSYDGFLRHAALDAPTLKRYNTGDHEYLGSDGLLTEKEALHIRDIAAHRDNVHLELVRAMRGSDLVQFADSLERQLGGPEVNSSFHSDPKDYTLEGEMRKHATGEQVVFGQHVSGVLGSVKSRYGVGAHKPLGGAAARVTDTGVRNVRLVPSEELAIYLRHSEAGAVGIPIIGAAFRRAVLPFSTKWLAGNFAEAELRKMMVGLTPFYDVMRGRIDRNFMDRLNVRNPQLAAEFEAQAGGGLMFASQTRNVTRTKRGLAAERGDNGKVIQAGYKTSRAVINGITDQIFGLNSAYEHSVKRQVRGKAFQREIKEFTGSWTRSLRAQEDALNAVLRHWEDNPRLAQAKAAEFGRYVDETLGKYSKFSPELRKFVQGYAPFIAWTLNSIKFMGYLMPVKHPVLSGVIATTHSALDDDLKKWIAGQGPAGAPKGSLRYAVDTGGDKMPGWLQTITGWHNGGLVDINRLTPVGAFTDSPLKTLVNNLVPQFTGAQYIGRGLNPVTGKPLRDQNGGKITDNSVLFWLAVSSLAEATVPGVSQARRLLEGGGSSSDNSVLWPGHIHSKKGSANKGALVKVFSPVPITYLGGSGGSGSIADEFKRYQQAAKGGSSIADEFKKYQQSQGK